MAYIREVCVAGDTVEICKYHTVRTMGKREGPRAKKEKPSCECQMKINSRKAKKNMRRLLNHNFYMGDLLVTLDYRKENAPSDSSQMQDHMKKFLVALRKLFKKAGKVLKYLYVKEIGPRGSRHIHIVMSKCDSDWLLQCWKWGGIDIKPLHTRTYEKIAEYFSKYSDKTIETEGELVGKRYYPSRTLDKPLVIKKVIRRKDFNKRITDMKGYTLDKNSVQEGVTDMGYRYFSVMYIRDE